MMMMDENKIKKIVWPEKPETEYLQAYIDQILEALSIICDCPGMADAYVSDQSALDHFFIVLSRTNGKEEAVAIQELKEALMVELDGTELLTTIAKRMAGLI